MMTRGLAFILTGIWLLLAACHAGSPVTSSPFGFQTASTEGLGEATVTFSIAWPDRALLAIPLSAESIRLQVLKGEEVLKEVVQRRSPGSLTAKMSITLEAEKGLTIRAEAFESTTISAGAVPIAKAELTDVTLYPNQRRALKLTLVPSFVPRITGISPLNGGPGVPVVLTGDFGDRGPYAAYLGGFAVQALALDLQTLETRVPDHAQSGSWMVRANGIHSEATGSFQVLRSLNVTPSEATASVGASVTFTVPDGLSTEGVSVSTPTVTAWKLVDPATQGTTTVGTLSKSGQFQANEPGWAEVQVFSGSLLATASVQVQ